MNISSLHQESTGIGEEKKVRSHIKLEKLELRAKVSELARKCTWLTVPEAAAYGNFSLSKLYELISKRTIPSSNDGGDTVIRRQDVDDYWMAHRRMLPGADGNG